MDGVGLVSPQLFGVHLSLPYYFPLPNLFFIIDWALWLDKCSGNLLRVWPGYLIAGLNGF
jgi:hypothetical protein